MIREGVKTAASLRKRYQGWHILLDESAGHAKFNIANSNKSMGHVMLKRVRVINNETGKKDPLWIITLIEAGKRYSDSATPFEFKSNKWGPLLYDLAIEYATAHGVGLLPAEAMTYVLGTGWGLPVGGDPKAIAREKANGRYFTKPSFQPYQDRGIESPNGNHNTTSPDAQRIYDRIFRTGKGIGGVPIKIISASPYMVDGPGMDIDALREIYGLSVKDLPWDWCNDEKYGDKFSELKSEAIRDGWNGKGWPITKRMGRVIRQRWIDKKPALYAVYSKAPKTLKELDESGLLVRTAYV